MTPHAFQSFFDALVSREREQNRLNPPAQRSSLRIFSKASENLYWSSDMLIFGLCSHLRKTNHMKTPELSELSASETQSIGGGVAPATGRRGGGLFILLLLLLLLGRGRAPIGEPVGAER
jgi:hypothetical protein